VVWKKLSAGIEMWDKPCLGGVKVKEGERFMALCLDPSSKKGEYRGVARQVTERKGDVDVVGFVDRSKLITVESRDLLNWDVVSELKIKGIEDIIKKHCNRGSEFIGIEDPDIIISEDGTYNLYFTIAYKNEVGYTIFLGHAMGESLDNLKTHGPVIHNNKEITFIPGTKYLLTESWYGRAEEGIGLVKFSKLHDLWEYERLLLESDESFPGWIRGYASPCRFIDNNLGISKNYLLGVCNGNSGEKKQKGKKLRGDFMPGLLILDRNKLEIPWVDEKPLLKDPEANTITFASEFVDFDGKHGLLYAQVNDSFVRVYKISYDFLKSRVPDKYVK
jgi:hypothetical protein